MGNNGHEPEQDVDLAAILEKEGLNPEGLKSGEGVISEGQKPYASVLQKIVTVPEDPMENYLQVLLLGNYIDTEEADRCSAAITEAKRYGLSIEPILAWAVNRCAVAGKDLRSRVQWGIEGCTGLPAFSRNTTNAHKAAGSPDSQQVQQGKSGMN